jgi:hypothetical protein
VFETWGVTDVVDVGDAFGAMSRFCDRRHWLGFFCL